MLYTRGVAGSASTRRTFRCVGASFRPYCPSQPAIEPDQNLDRSWTKLGKPWIQLGQTLDLSRLHLAAPSTYVLQLAPFGAQAKRSGARAAQANNFDS